MQLGSRGVWTMLCRSDRRDCVPPTPRCRKKICNLEFFLFEKLIHLVGVFCFPLYMESIFDMASDTNSTCEQQAWNNKTLNHIKKLFFRRRQCKRSNFALEPGRWVLHHKMHCVPHQSRRRSSQSGPGIQGGYNGLRSRPCYLVLRLFDCHPQCDTCKGSNLDHESAIRKSWTDQIWNKATPY